MEITVHEIRGNCPVYKIGDKMVIDDPKILLNETDALCTHALSTILHYVLILEAGADPVRLGLSKSNLQEQAFLQCVDPGAPYTNGGTVIFRIKKLRRK